MTLTAAAAKALMSALAVALPTPEQTDFLRACLCGGPDAADAWRAWSARVGDPKRAMAEDRGSVKRLLPLLYVALQGGAAGVDRTLLQYLRLAYIREQMRSTTYLRICGEILGALDDAGVTAIPLRGAALAATIYDDPAQRHCHDLALLIAPGDVERAAGALARQGLERVMLHDDGASLAALLRHETTLPVEMHTRLFATPLYAMPFDDVLARSVEAQVAGRATRLLAADDALIHVCVHASYSESRASLRWVGDAWHLIRRHPDLDWNRLIATTERASCSLPMLVALRYLAEELGAPVGPGAVARLTASARASTPVERDLALHGARLGAAADAGSLLRAMPGGLRVQARVATWLLFPSRAYVRDVLQARGALAQIACYASRPLDYLRRRWSSPRRDAV